MSQYTRYPTAIPKYANSSLFPVSAPDGTIIEDLSTHTLYAYDPSVPGWVPIASPGAAIAIDGLTGDGTAAGPGVVPFTLATVNPNVGTFTNATITVNGKGLITAAATGSSSGITSINSDTTVAQTLSVGTAGTDFHIVDAGSGSHVFDLPTASASNRGALSSADWTTFNNKQPAGSYITALTGDGTATGPGSVALTFATVNANVGSFTNANITVNAKGLITAAANGSSGSGTVTSVALTVPSFLAVSGSPITTSGTLAVTLNTETANTVFAGPTSGGAATPTFRALVAADLPAGTGTVTSVSFTDGSTSPIYTITGSPITTSGTITETLKTQTAATVFAGPISGAAAQPTFRALASTDVPLYTVTTLTGPTTYTILTTDSNTVFLCNTTSGVITMTLPVANRGFHFWVKDPLGTWSTNNVVIAQNASETIEGIAASKVLQTAWGGEEFLSGNTNWHML